MESSDFCARGKWLRCVRGGPTSRLPPTAMCVRASPRRTCGVAEILDGDQVVNLGPNRKGFDWTDPVNCRLPPKTSELFHLSCSLSLSPTHTKHCYVMDTMLLILMPRSCTFCTLYRYRMIQHLEAVFARFLRSKRQVNNSYKGINAHMFLPTYSRWQRS